MDAHVQEAELSEESSSGDWDDGHYPMFWGFGHQQ
jgi:hypothetical protein